MNPLFCWELLRVVIPKQKDEICLYGKGLKSLRIGQSAGNASNRRTLIDYYVGASASKREVSHRDKDIVRTHMKV